ncbi:MAG: LacI family DNA-binding transcriptional regulator [Anaerolineales bacterium]|jgi:DNA-binding LacI/PurR family transcriptional regulator
MSKSSRKHITIKQVAELAGVSTATVSRVISGSGPVSKKLLNRVQKAIEQLDYHPNQTARRLRRRNTKFVGVIISDIQNPYFSTLVEGIESVLLENGYLLLLGNTSEDPEREQQHLDIFMSEHVSGVIFASTGDDISSYKKFRAAGVPLVAVDRKLTDLEVDSIQLANDEAAFKAVSHFLTEGHQRIGLISGPENLSTGSERRAGYQRAILSDGLPIDQTLIQISNFRQEGGYQSMGALLDLPKPPTAVLVANNLMTLGALQMIHERNLNIPDQVSLIGFDDMAWASSLRPPLTVLAQPVYEMGITAARLLLDRIKEAEGPFQRVIFEAKLIIRASCRCAKDQSNSLNETIQ